MTLVDSTSTVDSLPGKSPLWNHLLRVEWSLNAAYLLNYHFGLIGMYCFQMNLCRSVQPQVLLITWTEPLRISKMGVFYGPDAFLPTNRRCQSAEGNTKHWPQPVAWPHHFFIHLRTTDGRGGAAFNTGCPTDSTTSMTSYWQWDSPSCRQTNSIESRKGNESSDTNHTGKSLSLIH